ncbi:Putative phospholipid-binding domain family protein [Treponema primitia ZAS-2]|uniref:Putative phospholipid-binding domain family protein n=1 Tax=Treponema primitia (strain ATCC BAA-887 / DSM 12427 / ZAS-2) TaxID=545694 RepID=F5YKN9_TREPZ|nr:cytidylate kinase family protein [Treponema primitia]AEF84697.1 Putative phospholipid-binding domain family protein [Treponema primitia ZAS-2]
MAIITISRQLAALGDETATELAKLLGYRFVDKLKLEERIKSFGIVGTKLEKYDERKPSFFASLSQDRDDYLHFLKTAMLAEASEGSCVFIGRGAAAVFKNIPGVLSVFLVAPTEIRYERVKSYFHCDEKRARQIIEQSDHDRFGFHRYFFDIDWREGSNYHLTLNMGNLHPALAAKIIKDLRDHIISQETEAQNEARLKEMILGQQAIHHILYERELAIHFLEAAVSGGELTLFGVASSQVLIENALNAAREVPGISVVRSDIQVVQEFNIVP